MQHLKNVFKVAVSVMIAGAILGLVAKFVGQINGKDPRGILTDPLGFLGVI